MSREEAVKQEVALEVARRDLADIKHLQTNEPFRRYFRRRLKERATAAENAFKYDPLDSVAREAARQVMIEHDKIAAMMDEDFASYSEILKTVLDKTLMPGSNGFG